MSHEQKLLDAAGKKLAAEHGDELRAAASLIRDADHVLICGGAGMSIGNGLNYTDPADFKRQYPAMLQYGLRTGYDTMGLSRFAGPDLVWGFLAQHIFNMRFRDTPHSGYSDLLALVKNKDYFVLVSNVDGLFERAGFDKKRIYTPQGDFKYYQCLTPCSREVWETKALIDKVRPSISSTTHKITDEKLVPKCPKCGGKVMANVRGGGWFIHDHYAEQNKAFVKWVEGTQSKGGAGAGDKKLVVVEIGAGFNTPVVTRFPCESIARWHRNGALVRINLDRCDVPRDLVCAVGLPSDGRPALALLRALVEGAAAPASASASASASATETKSSSASLAAESSSSPSSPSASASSLSESLQRVLAARESLRQRVAASARASGRPELALEQWQLFEQHQGHFDWRVFMASLARNDDDDVDDDREGEAEEGAGQARTAQAMDESEESAGLVAVEDGAAAGAGGQ